MRYEQNLMESTAKGHKKLGGSSVKLVPNNKIREILLSVADIGNENHCHSVLQSHRIVM